jgi:serine phosphatase RsbU (regulator of sigma subunit)
MAFLVALDEGLAGRRFSLEATCLVGRGPYNHVVLNDNRISRQHAKVSPETGGHVVYDLNSANGTYVNDVQIKRHRLLPDDVVRFGPFSFRFESGDTGRVGNPVRVRSEELTRRGFEPPSKIVGTLDVSQVHLVPAVGTGLVELEDAARKLRTLYAFMTNVSASLEPSEMLDRILECLLEVFPAAAMVGAYVRDAASGVLVPRMSRRDGGVPPALDLSAQFLEEVVGKGRAVLSAPITSLSWEEEAPRTGGSSMHAPMIHRAQSLGVLHVRGQDPKQAAFGQAELDMLTAIAAQAAIAMSNARLVQESMKQQRLQQDLVLAEQIQKSFLPASLPDVPGIEFVTEYRPAYSVGGDFYDVFWLAKDRLAIFIGDVSGKGVSAALLMARVSSDLRAAAFVELEPASVLTSLNRTVIERNQPDIFVTVVYLTLDVRTRRVRLANAGHLPPVIRRRAGGLQRVEGGTGTAIGILDDASYEEVDLTLESGDTLLLCTDGVLEATDASGAQFGFEGLEAALEKGSGDPEAIAERLDVEIRRHVGDAAQYDDLTFIACGIGPLEDAARDESPSSSPVSRRSRVSHLTLRPPPARD